MIGYIIRRIGQALIVILGVTLLVFLLSHVIPGGEAWRRLVGAASTPQAIRQFNVENGFTLPFYDQYPGIYLRGLVTTFNLGDSNKGNNQSVNALISGGAEDAVAWTLSTVFA